MMTIRGRWNYNDKRMHFIVFFLVLFDASHINKGLGIIWDKDTNKIIEGAYKDFHMHKPKLFRFHTAFVKMNAITI
jgi:hypothetical protein